MKFISALCLFLLVGCDGEFKKSATPRESEGIKIYNNLGNIEYVLPLSKVSKEERARVEAILERQRKDPLSSANCYGYEYTGLAKEYSDARALMTDWLVAEKCPQNLQKLKNCAMLCSNGIMMVEIWPVHYTLVPMERFANFTRKE